MTKLGYQPKILLPEGEFFRFEILSADIEDGEYGYQLGLELKTLGGKHAGHTFKDWSKISGGLGGAECLVDRKVGREEHGSYCGRHCGILHGSGRFLL